MKIFFVTAAFVTSSLLYADPYSVFEQNGKYGLKNQIGEILIPAVYEAIGWSERSFSLLNEVTGYKQNNQWGLITIGNQVITNAEYFSLYPASASLIIGSKRSPLTLRISTGCIDTSGKVIIPFSYSGLKLQSMRAIVYTLDGNRMKYGLIDLSNKIILPQFYKEIYPIGSLRYAVQNFNNKTALFTENGKPITGFVIDSITQITNNLAIVYQDGKQGIIDRDGQFVKQPIFSEILLNEKSYYGRLPNEWHIMDASSKLIRKIEADSIVAIGINRLKLVTATGTQLTDMDFAPIGKEKMERLNSFQQGLAVFRKNNKAGVIRPNGSILLPAAYDHVQIDKNFLIVCSLSMGKRQYALYDTLAQKKTTKAYDGMQSFNGSFFPVMKNGFYGGIDQKGNEIIACAYDSLLGTYSNLIVVKFRGQYGIITVQEKWVVLPQPNKIRLVNADRYFEYAGGLTFLKAIDGTIIYFTSNQFQLQGNLLIENVSGGGKWAINLNGQIIHRELPSTEPTETIFPSSEGLRGIKKNGKYGFIDDLGRLRIANRYEGIMAFQEGLAGIKIRDKWGFINKEDKIVIQPAYEEVHPFENGLCKAKQNGKCGILNNQGKIILEFRFDEIHPSGNSSILLVSGKLVGLADNHGNMLLQPKYESIEDLNNGQAIVKQNGKFGVVNLQGVSTIPIQYDQLMFEPNRNIFFGLIKNDFVELKM